MKCNNCHNEWNEIDNKYYIFCPFCHELLVQISEEINTMEDALNYLTQKYNSEILSDKQTVLQFIDVILPGKKRERNFLNMAYADGLVSSILTTKDDPAEKQQMFVQQAIRQLQDDFGVSEEWANYIMSCIASCSGIRFQSNNSSIQKRMDAENGDCNAQLFLALEALDNEDLDNYTYWIRVAIENGSENAKFHYGKYLYQQVKRKEEGVQLLMNSSEEGNVDAICFMAMHISSLSVENSKKIANIVGKIDFSYELLSVQQLVDLTFYYEQIHELDKAIALAESAYAKEPANVWMRYSDLLKKRSNAVDTITVGKIYRQMAENGNITGVKLLAEYVEEKASSPADMKTALYWYKVAADAGNVPSQLRLAKAYEIGERVDRDIDKAVEWYEMAAANGSEEAYQKISFMSPHCIRKTVALLLEDDSVLKCDVKGFFSYQGNHYLIIIDPDTHESIPLLYQEIGRAGDFEVNPLDEDEEKSVLKAFRRMK